MNLMTIRQSLEAPSVPEETPPSSNSAGMGLLITGHLEVQIIVHVIFKSLLPRAMNSSLG